jgi:hypothetical protein
LQQIDKVGHGRSMGIGPAISKCVARPAAGIALGIAISLELGRGAGE